MQINRIYQGDCMELMQHISDKSVDMILCDLPYGISACKWDTKLPLHKLWKQYNRVLKYKGIIVLTASQPYTSELVMSNPKMFKYDWIFLKTKPTGFLNSKKMPLRQHEEILVFYNQQPTYNPKIMKAEEKQIDKRKVINKSFVKEGSIYNNSKSFSNNRKKDDGWRFPISFLRFKTGFKKCHPTQKPLDLFRYLIETYTNERDLVLDNCIGSGTTAVACKQLNRNFIGFEINKKYVNIANKRLEQETLKTVI